MEDGFYLPRSAGYDSLLLYFNSFYSFCQVSKRKKHFEKITEHRKEYKNARPCPRLRAGIVFVSCKESRLKHGFISAWTGRRQADACTSAVPGCARTLRVLKQCPAAPGHGADSGTRVPAKKPATIGFKAGFVFLGK